METPPETGKEYNRTGKGQEIMWGPTQEMST